MQSVFLLLFYFHFMAAQDITRDFYVYADSKSDLNLQKQNKFLAADPNGLAEREIRIIHGNKKKFQVILYGKDGGEKFRSDTPVSLVTLYAIVDGMPMRKEEMKKR